MKGQILLLVIISHIYLNIMFNPKIIKGQGLKLFIESPVAISNIVMHISDQGNSTLTKGNLMA